MADDKVRMTAKTVFGNERMTVFPSEGPPEGVKGRAVQIGETFETDLDHAKDLARLGHAEADDPADLDRPPGFLEPHHQVSEGEVRQRFTEVNARRGAEVEDARDLGPAVIKPALKPARA